MGASPEAREPILDQGASVWPAAAVVICAALVLYWPALSAGFLWDDDTQIEGNVSLRTLAGLWSIWTDPGSQMQYYPISYSLYWIGYQLWGSSPVGYHAVSVSLHAICGVLVMGVFKRLALRGALAAALVFTLHPVQLESIAWVAEQRTPLSTAFYLLAVLAWARHLDTGCRRAYAAALICFGLAGLSKTMVVTFPLVLVLWTLWREPDRWKERLLAWAPFFGLALIMAMVTVLREDAYFAGAGGAGYLDFWQSCQIAGRAILFYLGKLVWPHPLMSIYPRWAVSPMEPLDWLPLVIVSLATGALFALRERIGSGPLVALLFFVLTLAPVLGFVDFGFMGHSFVADRYLYLAGLGPIALFAAGWARACDRLGPAPAHVGLAVLCALFLALGRLQLPMYQDQRAFWEANLIANPSATAFASLAEVHRRAGRTAQAERLLRKSLKHADTPRARIRLGMIYMEVKAPRRALAELQRALELTEGSGVEREVRARALVNLGILHYNFGAREGELDWRKAAPLIEAGLALDPGMTEARAVLEQARARERGE